LWKDGIIDYSKDFTNASGFFSYLYYKSKLVIACLADLALLLNLIYILSQLFQLTIIKMTHRSTQSARLSVTVIAQFFAFSFMYNILEGVIGDSDDDTGGGKYMLNRTELIIFTMMVSHNFAFFL
jgi:hypothetical protein